MDVPDDLIDRLAAAIKKQHEAIARQGEAIRHLHERLAALEEALAAQHAEIGALKRLLELHQRALERVVDPGELKPPSESVN